MSGQSAIEQGAANMHKAVSAASTNATLVKAGATRVFSIQVTNVNAAVRYLKLYNSATLPVVATTTIVKTLAVPGGTAGTTQMFTWPNGLLFPTGLGYAMTTEATDAGTTGVSASEHVIMIDYS